MGDTEFRGITPSQMRVDMLALQEALCWVQEFRDAYSDHPYWGKVRLFRMLIPSCEGRLITPDERDFAGQMLAAHLGNLNSDRMTWMQYDAAPWIRDGRLRAYLGDALRNGSYTQTICDREGFARIGELLSR